MIKKDLFKNFHYKYIIILSIIILFFLLFFSSIPSQQPPIPSPSEEKIAEVIQESNSSEETPQLNSEDTILLDVPLLNQLDEPMLYNGCEVTSLAMLFQFYGMDISKNTLADAVISLPFQNEEGLYSNPHEGFVGDITGDHESGYSIYSDAIAVLAADFLPSDYKIIELTNHPFDDLLIELMQGHPVWVITTVDFEPTDDMGIWQTPTGEIAISWSVHSVLLTGFDQERIFLNDPYGEQREVNRQLFEESWIQMGRQALTIAPINE